MSLLLSFPVCYLSVRLSPNCSALTLTPPSNEPARPHAKTQTLDFQTPNPDTPAAKLQPEPQIPNPKSQPAASACSRWGAPPPPPSHIPPLPPPPLTPTSLPLCLVLSLPLSLNKGLSNRPAGGSEASGAGGVPTESQPSKLLNPSPRSPDLKPQCPEWFSVEPPADRTRVAQPVLC